MKTDMSWEEVWSRMLDDEQRAYLEAMEGLSLSTDTEDEYIQGVDELKEWWIEELGKKERIHLGVDKSFDDIRSVLKKISPDEEKRLRLKFGIEEKFEF